MASSHPTHLEPSQLGTKEYWDAAYTTELTNHASDPTDTGHSWFSESDAEGRVARYLENLTDEGTLSTIETSFLDLGTGNGQMLFELRDEGWQGVMLGVDYSEGSVELARRLLKDREAKEVEQARADVPAEDGVQAAEEGGLYEHGGATTTRFEVWDLLEGEYEARIMPQGGSEGVIGEDEKSGWGVVLDKGTFDAISLSGQVDGQGGRIVEGYRARVKPLVRRNSGLLLITSCNWTERELEKWFAGEEQEQEDDGGFEVLGRVKYPSYKFGGQEGQTISTVCFRRT